MRITYLFDPLCGWCYGADAALQTLSRTGGIALHLAPTGLFAGRNARSMDASFASFAWANDQRIASLSGQIFSEAYRSLIFDTPGAMFDSAPATLGLIAVGATQPKRELAALKALQHARYVEGRNTADIVVVADVLAQGGLRDAASRLSSPDAELLDAYDHRVHTAHGMMTRFGAQGVPALIVENGRVGRLVQGNALHGDIDALMMELKAA